MIANQRVLAVVPARSGSKGIPDKNLQPLGGYSLIARAARLLRAPECAWIDRAIISTDAPAYAAEAEAHGLAAPFLRPPELSTDTAGAVETLVHALLATEQHDGVRYDMVLIVEPTCPFRRAEDVTGAAKLLVESGADSVVTVSRVDTKFHPHKVLVLDEGRLGFYDPAGAAVKQRQSLRPLYFRNGACYALTRACLLERQLIFTEKTRGLLVERDLVNIDEHLDLEFARFLADVKGW
jgi:CMP-N,N'-diacetyllegionaminic acid synthase